MLKTGSRYNLLFMIILFIGQLSDICIIHCFPSPVQIPLEIEL